MKDELVFAADLIDSALLSQDTKALQTAILFGFGVTFAATTKVDFEHKTEQLKALDIILNAEYPDLVFAGSEIRANLLTYIDTF
jgi:hypothetical protein